jgi:quinol-cytochrome oxidoreductase complex cytochrome b subunit
MQPTEGAAPHLGFWEERTGWSGLKRVLLLEPLPGGSRWAAAFGSLLLFAFVLQVITGVLLALGYAPSEEAAWPSVNYIQEEVPLGAFIRALHHWGSSAMVVLLLVHLVQVFVWGAYKRPRELTWMVGVLLLFCTLGLAFTGYLLPWDQKAFWATNVGLGILSTVPGVGGGLRELLQGGPGMGNLTLTRFFTLHGFVLPGLLILLAVVHLYLFRLHGVTPPWWISAERLKARQEPFWPRQALKDGVLALVFLLALAWWAWAHPAPLEAPADPSQPYEARPEWYFMFYFQLLRYFQGPYEVVGTFVLPTLFFLILFFWPFLDRKPARDPRRRPVAVGLLALGTAALVGLTVYAVATDVRMQEPALAAAPAPVERAGPIRWADVAQLYNTNCAACHGVDGTGSQVRKGLPTIPDFTSMAWQMSKPGLEVADRIRDGDEPLMPAYRDKLTTQQILGVAVYVRAFAASPAAVGLAPAPQPAAKGPPAGQEPARPVTARMPAAQVFQAYCLACHEADGTGSKLRKAVSDMPDFTSARWQSSRSNAELEHSILEGKGKLMVAMKDKLGPRDAGQLVALVRGFRDGKPAPKEPPPEKKGPSQELPPGKEQPKVTPPADGTAERLRVASGLYRQYCLTCHGVDGRGSEMRPAMPALPDFTNPAWQEGVSNPHLAVTILDGKGALMPTFRGRVGDEQAQDLAAYVRAFGPVPPPAPRPAPSDFDRRFRELQAQWDELQRQLQESSRPPGKP